MWGRVFHSNSFLYCASSNQSLSFKSFGNFQLTYRPVKGKSFWEILGIWQFDDCYTQYQLNRKRAFQHREQQGDELWIRKQTGQKTKIKPLRSRTWARRKSWQTAMLPREKLNWKWYQTHNAGNSSTNVLNSHHRAQEGSNDGTHSPASLRARALTPACTHQPSPRAALLRTHIYTYLTHTQ